MNLKVGMYVRTRLGIGKIINVSEDNVAVEFSKTNIMVLPISHINIKKASFNIIDLIELGDILKVIYDNKEYICKVVNVLGNKGVQINSDLSVSLGCVEIKSIVTKEQFESMKYRIGGN